MRQGGEGGKIVQKVGIPRGRGRKSHKHMQRERRQGREGGRARLGSARLGPVGLPPGPAPARLGLGTAWAPMPATTKLKVSDQRRTSSSA